VLTKSHVAGVQVSPADNTYSYDSASSVSRKGVFRAGSVQEYMKRGLSSVPVMVATDAIGTERPTYSYDAKDTTHFADLGSGFLFEGIHSDSGSMPFLGLQNASGVPFATFYGPQIVPLYTPASSSAPCTTGQLADDASYHYVCVASNTWKRVALTSF
jgi:hypothetical protein